MMQKMLFLNDHDVIIVSAEITKTFIFNLKLA